MKEHRNSEKGITLITLAVTIIILLIIIGIAIGTLTGDNGLFNLSMKVEENIESIISDSQYEINALQAKTENIGENNSSSEISSLQIINFSTISTPGSPSKQYVIGEAIEYQMTIKNTGNTVLKNLTLNEVLKRPDNTTINADGIATVAAAISAATIPVGGEQTFTWTHVVTESDTGGNLTEEIAISMNGVQKDKASVIVVTDLPYNCAITVQMTNVNINDENIMAQGFSFYVAIFSDEACQQRVGNVQPITFGSEVQATETFNNLQPGTYYVAETDATGNVITNTAEYDEGIYMPTYPEGQTVVITNSGQNVITTIKNMWLV